MQKEHPNLTISVVVEFNQKFLLAKRAAYHKNFPGLWAFTGGKSEIGETIIQTIRREVKEEAGLELKNQGAFLDSYCFGKTVGAAFLVQAVSDKVKLSDEFMDFVWIKDENELHEYSHVPGIGTHLNRAIELLKNKKLDDLEEMNLVESKYKKTK